jgi:hypothetical protein
MKITYIGHASVLAVTRSISILSDPWWRGPCFGAQWWNRPEPDLSALEDPPDYIYISHGHDDHYHPGTLKTLPTSAKVLVSSKLDLSDSIRELGFDVIEVTPDEPLEIGDGINVWIWPTHGGDTLFVLDDGDEVLINLNDALHSATRAVQDQHIALLKQRFPSPDYLFSGYGIASHFPNCYFIPGKNDARTAARRQQYFNGQWAYLMHGLKPRFGFPFAASVVFFEDDLIGLNEAVHNSERPHERYAALYPDDPLELIDIAPGFVIEKGQIRSDNQFQPINMARLRERDADAYARANRYSAPDDAEIERIRSLLQANIDVARHYLLERSGDYRFGILFRGSDRGILIQRRADAFTVKSTDRAEIARSDCDVTFETRSIYLRRSLTEDYADEVLFVGSGGVFRYRDRATANRNVHQELTVMMRKQDGCPKSRFGDNSPLMFRLKNLVKGLLGQQPEDLYDLDRWIVYD